jgi:Flp pilus assembly protein TadG
MIARIDKKFQCFVRDPRGVSAVEFALLLPIMFALYFGGVEISQGVSIDRKVTLTAGALANLTAQVTTLSTSDMTNVLNAATAVMMPYSASTLKITVSCISIDANSNATVKWSVAQGGSALSGTVSIPSALAVANTQLIYSQVSYPYTPTVGYTITGTLNLSDQMYMSPRITAPVYNNIACS